MFIDSHCHLSSEEFHARVPQVLDEMASAQVSQALCVCTTMEEFPVVHGLAQAYPPLFASVGVHPDNEDVREPDVAELVQLAQLDKVLAIGETGLDYYRLNGRTLADMEWQRERFRIHIRAARQARKPLVIHTRSSAADTLRILNEEGGEAAGGVFHCFTENLDIAKAAVDKGYYISFSGILTFKNAADLREVAGALPLDRLLIETDSPYLAPVPHRGKTNSPAYVPHVARQMAEIHHCSVEHVAAVTTENCRRLFRMPEPS